MAVLLLLSLLAWGASQLLPSPGPGIRLSPLELRLAPGTALPDSEGPEWVRQVVREGLQRQRLTPLDEGSSAGVNADESLHLRLQCREDLCLLGLTRQGASGEPAAYRQALLPPAAGALAWQTLIGEAVASLYREG